MAFGPNPPPIQVHLCVKGGDMAAPASGGRAHLAINVNLPKPADVDAIVRRAAGAGATVTMPPDDMFWGSRYGRVRDPFGHVWAFNAALKPASA